MAEKEDLRVRRTKEAIRKAFKEMICQMTYEEISIKELTEKANINRKTFYLHYNSLDDVLREFQAGMAQEFVKRIEGLEFPKDLDKITREFFLFSGEMGQLGDRLNCCSGSYNYISRRITNDVIDKVWRNKNNISDDTYVQSAIMAYVSQSMLAIYKQWVLDGKKIPLDDVIKITIELVCNGINNMELTSVK